jgi:hypothetical protein
MIAPIMLSLRCRDSNRFWIAERPAMQSFQAVAVGPMRVKHKGIDMASLNIRMVQMAAIGLLLTFNTTAAFSRAVGTAHDRWNDAHIHQLPQDIKNDIGRTCGAPRRAEHDFATFSQNGRMIVLNFEHLRCDNSAAACIHSGCLRQVYVESGGHYRRVRSYFGHRE